MTMHQWKTALITLRIHELNSVKFTLPGHSYCNYGAPNTDVEQLIKCAIHHLELDELSLAESWCEHAEHAQIAGIRELRHD